MPQLVEFPYLGEALKPVDALIKICRGMSEEGESRRAFKTRLREAKLWDRDRVASTFRFFRIADGPTIRHSEITKAIADTEDRIQAEHVVAERMWNANPLLLKGVFDQLSENMLSKDDLYIFLGSFAYRGEHIARPHYDSWMTMALEIKLLRNVGIGLAVGERGGQYVERVNAMDIDDFLEDDEPEPELAVAMTDEDDDAAPSAIAGADTAAVAAVSEPTAPPPPECDLPSPLGRGQPVAVSRFAGADVFDDDVLEETTTRLEEWWAEQEAEPLRFTGADFGFSAETWMDGAEEALYRVAVAAALAFRLTPSGRAHTRGAFEALDSAGVLRDLYYGTAPETLPSGVDSRALMLASLVARRCAESPDLAMSLEKQKTAADVFSALETALGRGFFRMELFWIMAVLEEIGALRLADLADYTVMPTRRVRDALFRLGFIATPYAHDAAGLAAAAAAAKRAAGEARPAGDALSYFALAAGCAYDCPYRKQCDLPCRERAE